MSEDQVRNGDPEEPNGTIELEINAVEVSKSVGTTEVGPANSQNEPAAVPRTTIESIDVKVTHNRRVLDVAISPEQNVRDLKDMLTVLTGIPADKQKVMWSKGACADNMSLEALGAKSGSKFMMVGSSNQEVTQIQTKPDPAALQALVEEGNQPHKLGEHTAHRKIIEKGIPADAMPGILGDREALPPHPISGMVNKRGASVRLTFKLELDQLWIGTKERTEKLGLAQIRKVVGEPILGHEEYHVIGLQVGPTDASIYWFYWVPAQYVDAIREIFAQFD